MRVRWCARVMAAEVEDELPEVLQKDCQPQPLSQIPVGYVTTPERPEMQVFPSLKSLRPSGGWEGLESHFPIP